MYHKIDKHTEAQMSSWIKKMADEFQMNGQMARQSCLLFKR
jgi:hypothetical protein